MFDYLRENIKGIKIFLFDPFMKRELEMLEGIKEDIEYLGGMKEEADGLNTRVEKLERNVKKYMNITNKK